ncbi:uncharacterized protein LOC144987080 [Oryzias latipes]
MISSSLSIDSELNSRIAKAAAVMAKLIQRLWNHSSLTEKTRLHVYQACVLSTLLYGSKTWTTYARHEKKLNTFHLRCLRHVLRIKWQDNVPNTEVLERANMNSMHSALGERRLKWLGHVMRMDAGRIPKDLLYGELAEGYRTRGRPKLQFKDVCKKDIDPYTWESQADDRPIWRLAVRQGTTDAEAKRNENAVQKRTRRKHRQQQLQEPSSFTCTKCGRDWHSRIGLHSHSRRCRPRKKPSEGKSSSAQENKAPSGPKLQQKSSWDEEHQCIKCSTNAVPPFGPTVAGLLD